MNGNDEESGTDMRFDHLYKSKKIFTYKKSYFYL